MESYKHAYTCLKNIKDMCELAQFSIQNNNDDIIKKDFMQIFMDIKLLTLKSIFNMNRDDMVELISQYYLNNPNNADKMFPNITDFSKKNIMMNVNVMLENITRDNSLSVDNFVSRDTFMFSDNEIE